MGILRFVKLKFVRPVDVSLVLISTKIVLGKSGTAPLISHAGFRLRDEVRHS